MPLLIPQILDFVLPAGDSAKLIIDIVDADQKVLDITGMVLKWSSEKLDEPATRTDLTVGSGITVIDAPTGKIRVDVPKGSITEPGDHRHELELVDGADSQTVLEGIIDVTLTLNPTT